MPRSLHGPVRRPFACLFAAAVALAVAAPAAQAHKAHAHGNAQLDVAIEPATLTLQIETPLDNLVGFERAPRTDAERRTVDEVVTKLRAADSLFRIDPAGGCTLARVDLQSAVLKLGAVPPPAADADHADLHGTVEFSCVDATKAKYIDAGLFDFKRMQRVDVQIASPRGQAKRALKRPANRITLGR